MADERLLDEEQYFRTRAGQLVAEAERRGISRRALLTATAAGLPLLAGTCRARASAHQPGGDSAFENAWVRWKVAWRPATAGSYELLARATDAAGRPQPETVPFNDLGNLFWAVVRHPVTVT
jgi:hypothetical protein